MQYPQTTPGYIFKDINAPWPVPQPVILSTMKTQIAKPLVEALKSLDQNMVKEALIPRFLDCFYAGCKDDELKAYVDSVVASK